MKAASYSRTSSYDKTGESIQSQQDTIRKHCAERGYALTFEFADRNVSGADMDAPELASALEAAQDGHYDVLVVREMDRFARDAIKQWIMEYEFRDAGVEVEYVVGDIDDSTLGGKVSKQVLSVIAEYERKKIRERIERGMRRAAERGNVFVAQNPPLGYRLIIPEEDGDGPRTLEVVEEEADLVRCIFRWYVYGEPENDVPPLSVEKIAERLTEARVPTKWDREGLDGRRNSHAPGFWHLSGVYRILTARTYTGEWIFRQGDLEIPVPVPAVIDNALFERAQRKRVRGRRRAPRNTKHEYLLARRVFCYHNGYRIHAVTTALRPGINNKRYSYYRCTGQMKRYDLGRRCDHGQYRVDYVDPAVWAALRGYLLDPDKMAAAFEQQRDDEQVAYLERQIALAEEKISKGRASLRDLFRLRPHVEGEHALAAFLDEQRRINEEIARQEERRDDLAAQLANTEERLAKVRGIQEHAEVVRAGVRAADRDFAKQRYLVEVLDVVVRLETEGKIQRAHVEVEGEHLTTVDVPPTRHKTGGKDDRQTS